MAVETFSHSIWYLMSLRRTVASGNSSTLARNVSNTAAQPERPLGSYPRDRAFHVEASVARSTIVCLWNVIRAGLIETIGSGHAQDRLDPGKLSRGDKTGFREVTNGLPGIELRLQLLVTKE